MASQFSTFATGYTNPIRVRRNEPTEQGGSYSTAQLDYVSAFLLHVRRWRLATSHSSIVADKVAHPDFVAIVNMGARVTPLIIRELRINPDFLFIALQMIHNFNAAAGVAPGKPREVIAAWIAWGEQNAFT